MLDTDAVEDIGSEQLAAILRRTGRLRRRILAHLKRLRESPANETSVLNSIRAELQAIEPAIAEAVTNGQIRAYIASVQIVASSMDDPPLPPSRFAFEDADDPGESRIRYPVIEQASEFLRTAIDYTPAEFAELQFDARQSGFTVARAVSIDTIRTIREAFSDDIARGGTLAQFRERAADAIDQTALRDDQIETLYRTNVGRAYAIGQRRVLADPMVFDEFPYLLYSATHDTRTRIDHIALESMGLNGTAVYRADDPIWETFFPPWDWNCRCVAIPLSVDDAARRGVREAQEWLRTGIPPMVPQFVRLPSFRPSKSYVPIGRQLSAVI